MHTQNALTVVTTLIATTIPAQSQFTVVPPAAATTDAVGQLWLPGAGGALRQQDIVGASLLQGMVGRTLTALEFRRNTQDTNFQCASFHLTVTLSISPNEPLSTSNVFADNVGPNPVQVFSGPQQVPASPATTTLPGWTPDNILRVEFTTPFQYLGGTLCVDMVGIPSPGHTGVWWPADAEVDLATGTVTDLGGGCGTHGGSHHRWAAAEARSLVPGSLGRFFAFGPLGSFAVLAFGSEFAAGWPLAMVLPAAPPGCTMFVDVPIALALLPFEDDSPGDGRADFLLRIPNTPTITGASLTAQWVEWSQPASSNAITWTVGGVPGINMAHVDGGATDPIGELFVFLSHVMRFEHD